MKKMKRITAPGAEPGSGAQARRERREMGVMRALFITREAERYVFAGFHYDRFADAVAQALRYLRKDAIGATIMLRPLDAQA